jgi:dTDP-4-dehydrorhamnose reductase
VEWVRADVRDADALARAARDVDAVVHTAYRQDDDPWSNNVDGSRAVARAARGARLVHLSTDIVFRGDRGRYAEADPPDPVNDYGRSKAGAELVVRLEHAEAVIVRTSLLYGGAPGPQERLAREATRFFVDEIRSPAAVGDVADALLELTGRDVGPTVHLGGADDVSRFEFALLLGADPARISGVHAPAGRPRDVSLDSSHARRVLETRLRGAREVLGGRPAL